MELIQVSAIPIAAVFTCALRSALQSILPPFVVFALTHLRSVDRSTSMRRSIDDSADAPANELVQLKVDLAAFAKPIRPDSFGQIATSFLPFVLINAAMYVSLGYSYLLTLALAVLAAGFVVRIFIIQHDCGHGAYFRPRWANSVLGTLCSVVTMTPYTNWRRQHAGHHGNWNNLDRRWSGADIYSTCLTVAEYSALTRWGRLRYRIIRHPITSLLILPPFVFLVLYRTPFDTPRTWAAERRNVHLTNAMLAAIFTGLCIVLGPLQVLLVQLPILSFAAIVGVWLFSVQHRFEHALWARHERWEHTAAALRGSSYLRLPRLLQWFTGSIGIHHVHHLNARIPNYRLQACLEATPVLRKVPTLSLWDGLRASRYVIWDETRGRMVGTREI